MKYRKKPVVIDAVQWDGTVEDATYIIDLILGGGGTARYHEGWSENLAPFRPDDINVIDHIAHIAIDTLEGTMKAKATDWIIRGIAGEFYPCDATIFAGSYDVVDDDLA